MRPAYARVQSQPVQLDVQGLTLQGDLALPPDPQGVVVFAHGSGSSRLSARNRFVASTLTEVGIGTLLVDLLTTDEEHERTNVFDIDLLADRLSAIARWLLHWPDSVGLSLGYFGASTGGGAALVAAARGDPRVAAVVSRGGRPDLAGDWLPRVTAPTLLLVGGRDASVLDLNREAYSRLLCPKRLVVVPGATHLFEEPGTLEAVAALAANWFRRFLVNHLEGARHASQGSRVRDDDRGY